MVQTDSGAVRTAPRLSTGQVGFLLAAPLAAVAARLLLTPWYQDEADRPDNARLLDEVVAAPLRNDIGAGLTLLSAILFACAAVVIGGLVRSRSPKVGLAGQALAVVGAFGLASLSAQQMVIMQAARVDDRAAMLDLLDRLYTAPQANLFFAVLLLGAVGWALLGFGLYRGRVVPRAAAVLVGIGGVAVMVTAPGPAVAFVAGAAIVAMIGLTWVALAAGRSSDS
jgi:hypothetical protein